MAAPLNRTNSSSRLLPLAINEKKNVSTQKKAILKEINALPTYQEIKQAVIKNFAILSKHQNPLSWFSESLPGSLNAALAIAIDSNPNLDLEALKKNPAALEKEIAKTLIDICNSKDLNINVSSRENLEAIGRKCLERPGHYTCFDKAIESIQANKLSNSNLTKYDDIKLANLNTISKKVRNGPLLIQDKIFNYLKEQPSELGIISALNQKNRTEISNIPAELRDVPIVGNKVVALMGDYKDTAQLMEKLSNIKVPSSLLKLDTSMFRESTIYTLDRHVMKGDKAKEKISFRNHGINIKNYRHPNYRGVSHFLIVKHIEGPDTVQEIKDIKSWLSEKDRYASENSTASIVIYHKGTIDEKKLLESLADFKKDYSVSIIPLDENLESISSVQLKQLLP